MINLKYETKFTSYELMGDIWSRSKTPKFQSRRRGAKHHLICCSHQIRRLEDWLGFKLFERSTRAIALTGAGRRYFNGVTSLLKRLEKITQNETTRLQNKTVITLQTTDSIATRWLIPRLPEIHRSNPELTVKIITNEFHEPFRSQEADIGILIGKGEWQQAYAQLLFK